MKPAMTGFMQYFGDFKNNVYYKVFKKPSELYSISCVNYNGKEYLKRNVYMCVAESLCCTAEICTTCKSSVIQ